MYFLLLFPICCSAGINLNLKPKFLSNILAQDDSDDKTGKSNPISIDVSGRYECLVRGSANEAPLVAIKQDPTLRVGVSYDFACPGLLSMVFTKLQWKRPQIDWKMGIRPRTGELSTSLQLIREQACLEIGLSSKPQATIMAQFIPHYRVNLVYNARIEAVASDGDTPPPFAPNKDDWWMPDLELSTSGRLQSSNYVSFRDRSSIRLLWSRSLGWFGTDDASTAVQLQLTQSLNRNHLTCATLHGTLEELQETAQITLSHEQRISK
jgi:hypothetical protein